MKRATPRPESQTHRSQEGTYTTGSRTHVTEPTELVGSVDQVSGNEPSRAERDGLDAVRSVVNVTDHERLQLKNLYDDPLSQQAGTNPESHRRFRGAVA